MLIFAVIALGYGTGLAVFRWMHGPPDPFLAAVPLLLGAVYLRMALRHDVPPGPNECPSCGYDLSGIEGKVCPECGWRRRPESGFNPE